MQISLWVRRKRCDEGWSVCASLLGSRLCGLAHEPYTFGPSLFNARLLRWGFGVRCRTSRAHFAPALQRHTLSCALGPLFSSCVAWAFCGNARALGIVACWGMCVCVREVVRSFLWGAPRRSSVKLAWVVCPNLPLVGFRALLLMYGTCLSAGCFRGIARKALTCQTLQWVASRRFARVGCCMYSCDLLLVLSDVGPKYCLAGVQPVHGCLLEVVAAVRSSSVQKKKNGRSVFTEPGLAVHLLGVYFARLG